ncbi:thiamine pyridinylase [Moorena sp. SIO3H5]|uniref:thiamine pyridinylase n=1 Tax=Moorena sp. SIO3H5 TaxID=2607834 RepID=UPI0025E6B139|nr:thiamine pyridinylase [Moorena sp. SIO3H5]
MAISLLGIGEASATELHVALYPYVPRLEQFQTAIQAEWQKVQPEVPLNFVPAEDWDGGYSNNPPENADVYVFDAMFFDYFRSQNWLEPIQASEINNLEDFVEYAIDGVKVGQEYYAIPQLGCANILFYHKEDAAIANATNLDQIQNALSSCTYTSEIPPDIRGMMLDMAGGTTNATLYLDIAHSLTGQYPFLLPENESQLNSQAIDNMQELLGMASYENATDQDDSIKSYQRADWFSDGWGRALMGYTEAMSNMSENTRQNIGFKVMPLSDQDQSYPEVFYADVIGVNTTSEERGTRDLAVKLANTMAASTTMIASIGADASHPYPQYLMATRPTIFQTLEKSFPLYGDMFRLIQGQNIIMFKVNDQSRSWLNTMKNSIRENAREDYSCGCDYPAIEPILNNTYAPWICGDTCADHGGWNGQWSNAYPAAQETSVCGCNACPLP